MSAAVLGRQYVTLNACLTFLLFGQYANILMTLDHIHEVLHGNGQYVLLCTRE